MRWTASRRRAGPETLIVAINGAPHVGGSPAASPSARAGAWPGARDPRRATEHRTTWRDALYRVLDGAREAAYALGLQAAICEVDLERHGLPGHLAL